MRKETDVESARYGTPENFFNEKEIRRQFVNKVYTILSAQVLYTVLVVAAFMNVQDMKEFALAYSKPLYFACSLSALGILVALTCVTSLRRTYPLNFLILFVFTNIVSVEVSVLCVRSPVQNVYTSCFLTAGLFALLTFLAYLNIFDISGAGCTLFVSAIILSVLSMCLWVASSIFKLNVKPFALILTVVVLFFVLVFIVYDTQIILGEGKVKLSEDEYILAVIILYIDLITLFKLILSLLNNE